MLNLSTGTVKRCACFGTNTTNGFLALSRRTTPLAASAGLSAFYRIYIYNVYNSDYSSKHILRAAEDLDTVYEMEGVLDIIFALERLHFRHQRIQF